MNGYVPPFEIVEDKADRWVRDSNGVPIPLSLIVERLNQPCGPNERLPGAIWLACWFHDTYESLAPQYGYETKPETRIFDASTPNGKLMIAVCRELRKQLGSDATGNEQEK